MVYIDELCRLIEHNGGNILDNISLDRVREYQDLKDTLQKEDVSSDSSFQDRFIRYFSLRSYRLKQEDIQSLFSLMEQNKEETEIDTYELAKHWLGEKRKSKFSEKHFASLSKMMNLINEDYPIYDQNVVRIFEFEPPKTTKANILRKINTYIEFYDHLKEVYVELRENDLLKNVLLVFKIKLRQEGIKLGVNKRIDLIIRSTGELKRKDSLIQPKYIPAYAAV